MKKIISILLLLTIFLTSCTTTSNTIKISYSGTVEATKIDIFSEIAGKVKNTNFNQGDIIDKGDIIFELDTETALLNVELATQSVNQAQALYNEVIKGNRSEKIKQAEVSYLQAQSKLDELINGSRPEEISQLESQIAKTKVNLESLKTSYDFRKQNYENLKELYSSGSASKSQLDNAKVLLDQAFSQLESANKQLESQQFQLELIKNKYSEESIEQARYQVEIAKIQLDLIKSGNTEELISQTKAGLDKAKAQLEIANVNLRKSTILSPISGTLLDINVDIGEIVFTGTNLCSVIDTNDLWVKIYVPQKKLNALKLNSQITLSSSSAQNTNIKGKIIYISPEAEFTPKNTETKEGKENTVFEVKIKILDNIDKLKPGMIVNTTF